MLKNLGSALLSPGHAGKRSGDDGAGSRLAHEEIHALVVDLPLGHAFADCDLEFDVVTFRSAAVHQRRSLSRCIAAALRGRREDDGFGRTRFRPSCCTGLSRR